MDRENNKQFIVDDKNQVRVQKVLMEGNDKRKVVKRGGGGVLGERRTV